MILLGLGSCNAPRDPSSYEGSDQFAEVSVHVGSRSSVRQNIAGNRLLDEFEMPAPSGTAMVIAVDAGTPFSADYNSVSGFYDKQLVDLATSTVTLKLPLNKPIQLFEYTFVDTFSLNSLKGANQFVFSTALLGPFTLTGSTATVELEANLEFALEASFDSLWANGSYNFEVDDAAGTTYFLYEFMNWQTMSTSSHIFNETSRQFEVGTSPEISYELINNQWEATSGHAPTSTFDRVDRASMTVYYNNPDFSARLVGLIDLSVTGLGDKDDGGDGGDGGEDPGFMQAEDFNPGSLGYILEIIGMTEAEFRLERIATSHDCANTEYSSLGDFIDNHTSSEFTCRDHDGEACLKFESYTPGQTSGNIIEVIRDQDHNIISDTEIVGTWEISTIQTKDLLFVYPDDTSYFHDDVYAPFWSELSGKVWEGYHPTGDVTQTPMYHATFNAAAVADFTAFLKTAPADIFIDNNEDSCNVMNWDDDSWDDANWAP